MQESEIQFHIKCGPEDVGGYCILPGDPGRCAAIARHMENPVFVGSNREYMIYTGTLEGEKVLFPPVSADRPRRSLWKNWPIWAFTLSSA